MTNKKVHPNASLKGCFASDLRVSAPPPSVKTSNEMLECTKATTCTYGKDGSISLTVWRKSLLLNCKGFTVYDGSGNIVFRVDNYVAASRGEIVLMDGHGKALLIIRRKKLSWGDNWQIYEGESSSNPKYLVQKQVNLLGNNSKAISLAQVQIITPSKSPKVKNNGEESILYYMEGSYAQRNVVIYNNKKKCVAQIKKKEAQNGVTLGGDVFKLIIVSPNDICSALAMGLVILLDGMFGSS